MPDPPEVADDLYAYAGGIARNILKQHGLISDKHRLEDITQTLFLDGWEVWRDKGEVGLAKYRMQDRRKNQIKYLRRDLNEKPPPISQITNYSPEGDESLRLANTSPSAQQTWFGGHLVEEFLNQLPDFQRQVIQLRMARLEVEEIRKELGLESIRPIQRAITAYRKALTKWRQTLCD